MAWLLPRLLLKIDVMRDKYLNTGRRLVTGGGNGGYGHTSLAESYVGVLVDCYVHAELFTFLCKRHQFIRPKRLTTERDRERVPEANDLAVALPRSSGTGRPDQTLCGLAPGRESVFGWSSADVRVDHHCARRQTNALVANETDKLLLLLTCCSHLQMRCCNEHECEA